jgi:hypothetical protein
MDYLTKGTLSFASHGAMLLLVFIITLPAILLPVQASRAATFDVTSKAEFQSALTVAQSNGEDDVINVAAGTIFVNGLFQQLEFNSSEAFSLTIKGAGAASTILEGVGTTVALFHIVSSDDVSISDMTFKNGTYVAGGGALHVEADNVTLERCIFTENGPGYTTWIVVKGDGYIANNIFSGIKGPGIFVQLPTGLSNTFLSNNTFDGNLGGGIEFDGIGHPTLLNNVIWGADSSERRISGYGVSVFLFNNIYSDISIEEGYVTETSTINSDPLFVTDGHWDDNGTPGDTSDDLWTDGDYHLRAGSPCIDSGYYSSQTPATDFEGNERIDDPDTENTTNVSFYVGDRGAYEYIPPAKAKSLTGTLLLLLSQ